MLLGNDCQNSFCKGNVQTTQAEDGVASPVGAQWEHLYPVSSLLRAVCQTQRGFPQACCNFCINHTVSVLLLVHMSSKANNLT